MVKKKTVFISGAERDHIVSGLRSGLDYSTRRLSGINKSYELFVILNKLIHLKKKLKDMEEDDNTRYDVIRSKMHAVKNNANRLLKAKHIPDDEMRSLVKRLDIINKQMLLMSGCVALEKNKAEDSIDSCSTSFPSNSISLSPAKNKKKKVKSLSEKNKWYPFYSKPRKTKKEPIKVSVSDFVARSTQPKRKRKKISVSSQKDTSSNQTDTIVSSINRENIPEADCKSDSTSQCPVQNTHADTVRTLVQSKSNEDKKYLSDNEDVVPDSRNVSRRWSIASVTRKGLTDFIRKSFKLNSKHSPGCQNLNKGQKANKKIDYIGMPGLVACEREHLEVVRNRILKNDGCYEDCSVQMKKKIADGCCFNSNSAIEIFETSDTSLKNEEAPHNVLYDRFVSYMNSEQNVAKEKTVFFKAEVTTVDGLNKLDGEVRGEKVDSNKVKERKPDIIFSEPMKNHDREVEFDDKAKRKMKDGLVNLKNNYKKEVNPLKPKDVNPLKPKEENPAPDVEAILQEEVREQKRREKGREDKATQTDKSSKVSKSTSYDNFILHPKFNWNIPVVGQAFRKSVPLEQERWRYMDQFGNFQRPQRKSMDRAITPRKLKPPPTSDKSVQTNDVLFTKNMNQVVYLNVVYTKTHLRYILPDSIKIPVLSQTPKIIERRAIDNGYAVTTYKADPDGLIHFTLAYSEGKKEGRTIPTDANRRLCQLKNFWIYSARKFFSQLSEKLIGESVSVSTNPDSFERRTQAPLSPQFSSSSGSSSTSAYLPDVDQSTTSDQTTSEDTAS